eukprot:TRINITY_DN5499_c0_g1_i1.p1 TRINITY_DN5499_c0_g1~~TRINITY_DN5499_c0_g1_i1.p1  ORF type:complete len:566 (+),score=200.06 TRINITY_DN5499_c0_g1_i1:84-1700(+)
MRCAGALALLGMSAGAAAMPRAARDKPNFVMLFVDDLGYGDLGFTGHPTTHTPNINKLAYGGRRLTTWYSGCSVCSGSRAALMTGRQYVRTGVPGVFGPTVDTGLPLNETTAADQLKKAGYKTAIMGKWHLGQRPMFLPASRGFDRYLGIPYSDDMGNAQAQTPCGGRTASALSDAGDLREDWQQYVDSDLTLPGDEGPQIGSPPLVLVHQDGNETDIVQQPLQFRTLTQKYKEYVLDTVDAFKADPFFLYMPFSHVHTTSGTQPEKQYAGCAFENSTKRGKFGDALAEVDSIVGALTAKIEAEGLDKNTMMIFSADNGPWMVQGKSAGSVGLLYGRESGYWNVGKGSTWEGGIREAAFAYWPGQIPANSYTSEIVSSLDLLPTVSKLAGVPLPTDRVYDGKDASDVMLTGAASSHKTLFFYGPAASKAPSAMRYGKYKAHFATAPGLSGCLGCEKKKYPPTAPLLFDIEVDPSEAYPLSGSEYADVVSAIAAAYDAETSGPSAMTFGKLVAPAPVPGEVPGDWGICCNRTLKCMCTP